MVKEQEKEKRETQKQKMTTMFNMVSSTMQNIVSNPKILTKAAYVSFCVFATYHLTKASVAIMTA